MIIEDTGSAFVFTSGNKKQFHPYGTIRTTVTGSSMLFENASSLKSIEEGDYADFTLVGIAGVTDAASLAIYIMEAS